MPFESHSSLGYKTISGTKYKTITNKYAGTRGSCLVRTKKFWVRSPSESPVKSHEWSKGLILLPELIKEVPIDLHGG